VHLSLISLRLKELCKHGGLYHNAPVKATLSDDGDRLDVSLWDGDRSSPATMHGVNCASSIPPPQPGFVGVSLLADPVEGVLAYVRERRARKSIYPSRTAGEQLRSSKSRCCFSPASWARSGKKSLLLLHVEDCGREQLRSRKRLLLPSFLGSLAQKSTPASTRQGLRASSCARAKAGAASPQLPGLARAKIMLLLPVFLARTRTAASLRDRVRRSSRIAQNDRTGSARLFVYSGSA
jgi:hypothetical protein